MASAALAPVKPATPRVLMADDHHLILDALGAMMKDDFEVQAVDSCQAFLERVEGFKPDVAVLDVNMPGGDGFTTARKVRQLWPDLPIVFLSMYSDSSYREQAARLGAKAYLSKRVPAHELIAALRTALDGNSLLETPSATAPKAEAANKLELTERQAEVLRLIAIGHSAKDIANTLNISVRTAEFHRAAIMQRLGLHSTAQLTRYAIAHDLS